MGYIDADKFAERIKVSPAFRNINDGLLLQRVVIDLLNNIPTADVVPKSEYDAVVSALDNSTKEFLKLHDDYQESKREIDKWKGRCTAWCEVAYLKSQRILELVAELSKEKGKAEQIFEEIEKTVFADMDFFKELKKKYTEEKS